MTIEASVLQPLLGDWPSAALARLESEPCVVRVIVARVRGSAPREPGACMLVDSRAITGTIGGGNLEREAIAAARRAIAGAPDVIPVTPDAIPVTPDAIPVTVDAASGTPAAIASNGEPRSAPALSEPVRIHKMTLGSDLAQCCGGVVELWVERLTRNDRGWLAAAANAAQSGGAVLATRANRGTPERACLPLQFLPSFERIDLDTNQAVPTLRERIDAPSTSLWLYGAGHVGRAVVRALAELPFQVTWVDSRPEFLNVPVPANTCVRHTDDPASLARGAPVSACHLVMTHDHGLDFEVCRSVLDRNEFAWLGLIGSASKAARFRSRLARAGIANDRIVRLVCPIGVGGLTSKLPAAIAASVTVQLLQELEHVAERALFQPREVALGDAGCHAEDCNSCRARQSVYR